VEYVRRRSVVMRKRNMMSPSWSVAGVVMRRGRETVQRDTDRAVQLPAMRGRGEAGSCLAVRVPSGGP